MNSAYPFPAFCAPELAALVARFSVTQATLLPPTTRLHSLAIMAVSPRVSPKLCRFIRPDPEDQTLAFDTFGCSALLLFALDQTLTSFILHHLSLGTSPHFPYSITATAILPQPAGKTAIVSGLNYITRIFALLGEILVRIRVDKRSPPQGPFATARLEEVRSLHARILGALSHAPAPLRLKTLGQLSTASGPQIPGQPSVGLVHTPAGDWPNGAGFRQATFAEVKDFFDNPKASRANAPNPFLVMQANLYVTQVCTESQ